MSHAIRFVLVGGFLGAGKTTTIARLARHYMDRGLRTGIVTNDQAADLVDTKLLRAQGFDVAEVAGACFCCRFDELLSTVERLGEAGRPDVVLAEPVGSCTDLVATVLQPLKLLYQARFQIAPYCVLLKPSHGRKVLSGRPRSGFSPKAEYILKKQLEEADAILINRVDELTDEQVRELEQLLQQHYPTTPRLRISARTGFGFDALLELLDQEGNFGRRVLELDYDTYAAGEAELGWLNATAAVQAARPVPLDQFLLELLTRLQSRFAQLGVEVAHLKAIGLWEGFFAVANLVATAERPQLSLPSGCEGERFELIVNARVACSPEVLEKTVRSGLDEVCRQQNATATVTELHALRPGRPQPTHRVERPVG